MPTIALYPPFDPLAHARRLKAANVPEAQAEAQAEALRDAFVAQAEAIERAHAPGLKAQDAVRELDAKNGRDIHELKADIGELKAHMDVFRAETQRDIRELRAETKGQLKLHNWMLTAIFALNVAIALKIFL